MLSARPRQEAFLSGPRAFPGETSSTSNPTPNTSTLTRTTASSAPTKFSLTSLRAERGSVTAGLIVLPLALLAVLMVIHFALIMHARNVATAAAQDGLAAAQLQGATPSKGKKAANNTLALFGGIHSTSVRVLPGPNTVTVTVKGTVRAPLGGLFTDFEVTRSGPLERFYFESERQ